ncbi:2-succinyl-5-enolpyruvyl-6-hydroxy-3-cyclohexene-1-carboxylic-acid synthase [Synechococcus sp. CS-1325]|uniref:2-succinyl-5-enolpyruvyl-6-hydroxy-3- cyclohexene-1-carboxylic-acid synthase n=1 Tax=Synechococcus sp. CS-1325 TaxID=2847979 RepID=UPI000DB59A6A|nr:2-succinyl-5-enolpyruvyl-6-hydroxy-3-cyclohexene-1-carboxylic-acid synthase [Synechococcus sp. CS-1325]MCT0199259.1 2-succinyl-5-enolpyruvyl-6-hydroxy-3-cyclohexene-1-carboxylic-acid synthase [Synechococcus sp. CS-1325]PZV00109.1 MAG: 2-succinyl-5-enolpyruvyl-6-hydroxy-3-cyclohexene-1-carboxylic-acid synthase [Cyanobium sp.]
MIHPEQAGGTGVGATRNLAASLELLQALQRQGLRRLVLCPGSRSGPLAMAAGLLAGRRLSLHTAIDERSAAFFALGLSRADGYPAAVVTTSGTAVANLLPAAVEADHGAIPLLLLCADRPADRKGCGANQTVNQEEFLRPSCRWVGEADPAGLGGMPTAAIERLAALAWRAATGSPAGPVHLNLPFDEPLHADAAALLALTSGLDAAEAEPAAAAVPAGEIALPPQLRLDPDQPGLIVAGPWRGHPQRRAPFIAALRRWQERSGWPLLADGLSGLRGEQALELVASYDLFLQAPPAELAVGQVLRLGPLPASRRLQDWLSQLGGRQLLICEDEPRNQDPLGTASQGFAAGLERWCAALPASLWAGQASAASLEKRQRWQRLEARCQTLLSQQLPAMGSPREPALARALSRLLPPQLPVMLASSSPVRDWESFSDPAAAARPLFGFRGASGIDGTLSLAAGLAESLGRLVLLTGDLALLHDSNGWLWSRQLSGHLTVVLIDNGGGGIFEQLPIRPAAGAAEAAAVMDFDRLFAMPQAVDHCALAAAHGVAWRRVGRLEQLEEALVWSFSQRLALLELRTDRRADAVLRQELRAAATSVTE